MYSEKSDLGRTQPTAKNFDEILELLDIRLLHTPANALREELGEIEPLKASIRQHGLLQPLVVRPLGDGFEIVAGCRRFTALKSLGWKKIPCIVADLGDEEAFVASLTENLQRETLDPVEEAMAYKKYIDDFGWGGETALATRIAKSQEHISQRLGLLKLPPDVIDLIRQNRLNSSVARELASIDDPKVQSVLGRDAVQRKLTVAEVKALVSETSEKAEMGRQDGERSAVDEFIERSKTELSVSKKTILALKVALIKVDSAIEDAQTEDEHDTLSTLLLGERQELRKILDDVINWKVAKTKELDRVQSVYG